MAIVVHCNPPTEALLLRYYRLHSTCNWVGLTSRPSNLRLDCGFHPLGNAHSNILRQLVVRALHAAEDEAEGGSAPIVRKITNQRLFEAYQ